MDIEVSRLGCMIRGLRWEIFNHGEIGSSRLYDGASSTVETGDELTANTERAMSPTRPAHEP